MPTEIDALSIRIDTESKSASEGIKTLTATLNTLKSAVKGGLGLTSVIDNLKELSSAASSVNASSVSNVKSLANAISTLKNVGNFKISSSIGNQIRNMSDAVRGLDGVDFSAVTRMSEALAPLNGLEKATGLSSVFNQLKKLPDLSNSLSEVDFDSFASDIQKLTASLEPLATQLNGLTPNLTSLSSGIKTTVNATNELTESNTRASTSYVNLWAKAQVAFGILKRIGNAIGSSIQDAFMYEESLNVVNNSLGQYASAAKNYAEQVGSLMGIDPAEWLGDLGIFDTIIEGFGVASDKAYKMSQNLTQLGYDLTSYYGELTGMSIDEAMQKLQSGISGELEPLRRLGYDLSNARLQQEAYNLGITKSVSSMNQAEKAQLRYYAIMTQVTDVQGDMARTLSSSANQTRVLQAELKQLSRAFGEIFLPAVTEVLPYIIAFVKAVRTAISAVAKLFGYTMTDNTSTLSDSASYVGSLSDNADSAASELSSAANAAEELKNATMGFDELNIISPETSSSSSGGSSSGGSSSGVGFDIDTPGYDFVKDAVSTRVDELMEKWEPTITWFKDNLDTILNAVTAIGAGFAVWKISSSITDFLLSGDINKIKNWFETNKIAIGLTLLVTGFTFTIKEGYDIGYDGLTLENGIGAALGVAVGASGTVLALTKLGVSTLTASGIGIILGLSILGVSIAWGAWEKSVDEDMASRFGDITLSDEEVQELANQLTTSDLSNQVTLYLDQKEITDGLKETLSSAFGDIQKLNIKADLGMDVSKEEYEAAADNLISTSQSYLDEKQVEYGLAIDAGLGDGETKDSLTEFVNTFYSDKKETLKELGAKLKKAISEGFVDGVWIEDKQQEVIDLEQEIQEIMQTASDAEYKAKLKAIELDASGTDLTYESFTALQTSVHDTVEEQLSNLGEVEIGLLTIAQMQFDQAILDGKSEEAAETAYNSACADINAYMLARKLEVILPALELDLEPLLTTFSTEMDKAGEIMQQDTRTAVMKTTGSDVLPEDYGEDAVTTVGLINSAYYDAFNNLDMTPAAKKNLKELVEALKPTSDQLDDIMTKARAAGVKVPEGISEGLKDIKTLEAMAGDTDALSYLIGDHLSSDETFLNMLTKCSDAGKAVNEKVAEGLKDNLTVVEDKANGTITFISDTMTKTVDEITPELVENLKQLGIDITDGLETGVSDNVVQEDYDAIFGRIQTYFDDLYGVNDSTSVMENRGEGMATDLETGLSNNVNQSDYKNIFGRVGTAAESSFGLNTGNPIMKSYGADLAEGLKTSTSDNLNQSDYETIFGRVGTAAETTFGFNTETPKMWGFGQELVTGLKTGASENLNQSDYDDIFGRIGKSFSTLYGFGESIPVMTDYGQTLVNNLKTGWENGEEDFLASVEKTKSSLESKFSGMKQTASNVFSYISAGGTDVTKMTFTVSAKKYASGGFPDEGEMFIARERGPELVGSIGSRTAVVNNNQIVEAVSQGVAAAVSSSMGTSRQTSTQVSGTFKVKGNDLVCVLDKATKKQGYTISKSFTNGGR